MNRPSSEKTEPPTPRRLREARKEGQVAKSKELVSAVIMVLLLFYFDLGAEYQLRLFRELLYFPAWIGQMTFEQALEAMGTKALILALVVVGPPVGIALIAGIFVNFLQIGALFAPKAAKPDAKRVNPLTSLKNIFSRKNLVELIKSIVKILILGATVTYILWKGMPALAAILSCGLGCLMAVLGALFREMVICVSVAFLIVAVADYSFQKRAHIKELRMTKDEVKRDFKESDGDPDMKGRRRSLFMEFLSTHETANVRRSNLIVANPVHVAVGLYFEREITPLPVVTLKEQGLNARRVVAIARREGIQVMVNVPLARSLLADAQLDRYVPNYLVAPVAEVLRMLQDKAAPEWS